MPTTPRKTTIMEHLPSTKPYLIRAIWEWCNDHGFTPYLLVQVDGRTRVPQEFVREGEIVLNIDNEATNKLQMGNDWIEFQARFAGVPRELSIPVGRVAAIYARENGAGMSFEVEEMSEPSERPDVATPSPADTADEASAATTPPRPEGGGGRPKLQRIK